MNIRQLMDYLGVSYSVGKNGLVRAHSGIKINETDIHSLDGLSSAASVEARKGGTTLLTLGSTLRSVHSLSVHSGPPLRSLGALSHVAWGVYLDEDNKVYQIPVLPLKCKWREQGTYGRNPRTAREPREAFKSTITSDELAAEVLLSRHKHLHWQVAYAEDYLSRCIQN